MRRTFLRMDDGGICAQAGAATGSRRLNQSPVAVRVVPVAAGSESESGPIVSAGFPSKPGYCTHNS